MVSIKSLTDSYQPWRITLASILINHNLRAIFPFRISFDFLGFNEVYLPVLILQCLFTLIKLRTFCFICVLQLLNESCSRTVSFLRRQISTQTGAIWVRLCARQVRAARKTPWPLINFLPSNDGLARTLSWGYRATLQTTYTHTGRPWKNNSRKTQCSINHKCWQNR